MAMLMPMLGRVPVAAWRRSAVAFGCVAAAGWIVWALLPAAAINSVHLGPWAFAMPGPARSEELRDAGLVSRICSCQHRGRVFMASEVVLDLPKDEPPAKIQERLDGARDGMLRQVQGRLIGETAIELAAGVPGREIQFDAPLRKTFSRARLWLHEGRVYVAMVNSMSAVPADAEATAFLESIALKRP